MKCYIFDIDDTLFIHGRDDNYSEKLIKFIQDIKHPKFILTNAIYEHANKILNYLGIEDQFIKIYSRDSMPYMKPHKDCYKTVMKNIIKELDYQVPEEYIFYDDLLENLQGAKQYNWTTVWIHPDYKEAYKYPFVNRAYARV